MGEKRANWITCLQEYNMEFKFFHTIKGHGLCQLVAEEGDATKKDILGWEKEIECITLNKFPRKSQQCHSIYVYDNS